MTRIMRGIGLAGLLLATALASLGRAQPIKGEAKVVFIDRAAKKQGEKTGTIEEGPGGIKLTTKAGKKEAAIQIAPADIVHVAYSTGDRGAVFRAGFVKEDNARAEKRPEKQKEMYREALSKFQESADELKAYPPARRYLLYRAAMLATQMAAAEPARRDPAVKMLKDFVADHKGGWQILPA
ncbi:MAG: hypothetical protein K2W96_13955, partial [Gemmataceae bacterium]|nr:hypothetical protein [Gemmataceae bacterium]